MARTARQNLELPGLFATWGMTSGDLSADTLASLAADAGAAWVAGQYDDPNLQHLPGLRDACRARGVAFGIWDAAPDSYRLGQAVSFGPDFWIAQSEGAPIDWRNLVGQIPHTLERGVVTNFSGLDDECLVGAGFACIPECYLPENPNAVPDGMAEEARRRGYTVVNCCLGVYWEYPLAAYPAVWPFSIWAAETMLPADWDELALRTVPPPPVNGGEPMPEPDDDWWEQPYKGGPMVELPGFPRPLYPPDAAEHGKKPSMDGPDVVAYKRTVSRAGRWPWQTFDAAYSNGFAHGKGGNVVDTGVEGVQRQQHLDATGWIGEKTFNTLRSIRVPEGKPHAGEMAMDGYAAELLEDAWIMFGGHEPDSDSGTVRQEALALARDQIGYKESPAGSNLNKYGKWYGMDGVPWCAIFTSWCYEQAGPSPSFAKGSYYSYVPYIVADARNGSHGLKTTDDPIPGDLVCYDWECNGEYDHVGLFEGWTGGTSSFNAIEGNTSTSSNSNGGQVMRRSRTRGGQATVFVRVSEP